MPELPNIVRERLKASQPASVHPDADALTAFAERALAESERAVVIEHLARCHDCRDILALSLPANVATETVRLPLPVSRGWLRTPTLRWGVVAAGFAVLAVTGILQFQRQHQAATYMAAKRESAPVPGAISTEARADAAKPMPGTPKAAPGSVTGFGNVPASSPDRVNAGPAGEPSASGALNPTLAAPGPPNSPPTGASIGGTIAQNSLQVPQRTAAPSSMVAASGAASAVAVSPADRVASKPIQYEAKLQQRDQLHGNAEQWSSFDAPIDKAKAPAVAGQNYGGPVSSALALAPRWAISTTGGLLRSLDQGQTWAIVDTTMSQSGGVSLMKQVAAQNQKYDQANQDTRQLTQSQSVPSQSQNQTLNRAQVMGGQKASAPPASSVPVFRALSAAGLEIWAGGTAGMLYHSADGGQQWTRVFLMTSGVPSTGDIVGIAFPDPQHGRITTSTQESWITLDAGQTWQKR